MTGLEPTEQMNLKKTIGALHRYERRVLPILPSNSYLHEIAAAVGLKEVEAMRALQWLQNKKIINLKTEEREKIRLDANGMLYLKKGMPEHRFLEALSDKETSISKMLGKAGLTKEELNVCLGLLRSKAAIHLTKNKDFKVKITEHGKELLREGFEEEEFLNKKFPIYAEALSQEEKAVLNTLRKRKRIIRVEIEKLKKAELLDLGRQLIDAGVHDENIIDTLSPKIIKAGDWKKKTFRRYDVKINVPEVFGGKAHPYRRFLDFVRKKFLSLGFAEMDGPVVETEFWNMDALFMPQFHSARDIHDAYYVKGPLYGKLEEKLVKKVKQAHENGLGTGSRGWRYQFDAKRTHRHILRTQGTACSARMLASKELKIPGKYFGITRCFRKDIIDSTHNVDFFQTEGIVVEEGLNLRHLIGLLKLFAKEFAEADEVKIVPGYFPFTEPSAELFARHKHLGWVELGGAGIFRPEVVKPLLGREISVLAWGLGIDRIAMFKLDMKDIRQLFSHDISVLRNSKVV